MHTTIIPLTRLRPNAICNRSLQRPLCAWVIQTVKQEFASYIRESEMLSWEREREPNPAVQTNANLGEEAAAAAGAAAGWCFRATKPFAIVTEASSACDWNEATQPTQPPPIEQYSTMQTLARPPQS